jgi:5'-3' exonuclease
MGIPNLNKYLLEHCTTQTISKKHMSCFSGKKVVIDTSIYLYKFSGTNTLMENMYTLITIFRYYKMIPIFVFDGKPPDEKMDLLKQRNMDKYAAETKYNALKQKLEEGCDSDDKNEIVVEMEKLRKQFIRIKKESVDAVKSLMDACGVYYCDAPGEADQLCAKMVISKQAWAVVSDDMDMFAYGCTRVMRHLSLLNHTVIFYNTNGILRELKIHMRDFREIMVLSGTDYNSGGGASGDLRKTMKQYERFRGAEPESDRPFHDWLRDNTDYNVDNTSFTHIYDMFRVTDDNSKVALKCSYMDVGKMKELLKPYGFIFV